MKSARNLVLILFFLGLATLEIAHGIFRLHIEPEIARFQQGQTHAQSAQLFQGLGGGAFREVSESAGPDFVRRRVARGLAAGDVDGDGDLDLVMTTNGGAPALLRNDAAGPREGDDVREGRDIRESHFVRVRLRGRGKNTRALGARVRLTAAGATQTRVARTGSSYLSQSESALTFGLGAARAVERLEVAWPGGGTRTYDVAGVDRTIELREE